MGHADVPYREVCNATTKAGQLSAVKYYDGWSKNTTRVPLFQVRCLRRALSDVLLSLPRVRVRRLKSNSIPFLVPRRIPPQRLQHVLCSVRLQAMPPQWSPRKFTAATHQLSKALSLLRQLFHGTNVSLLL